MMVRYPVSQEDQAEYDEAFDEAERLVAEFDAATKALEPYRHLIEAQNMAIDAMFRARQLELSILWRIRPWQVVMEAHSKGEPIPMVFRSGRDNA